MAVLLGQYYVANDLNLRGLSDFAFGLKLPLQMGTNTFFTNYDMVNQLKSNVTLLLRTQQGERPMHPTFGTQLHKLLFEPNDETLEPKIYDAINNAVRFWLPQLSISNIEIDQSNEMKDKNQVGVKVSFNVKEMNANFSVNFNMNNNS